jgi:hypothetical protein
MALPAPRFDHALITGASSGIGWAFAEMLAPRAKLLTLTARREERLLELAAALEQRGGARCRVVPLDLAAPDAAARLVDLLHAPGRPPVDLLVNNAGFGRYGSWARTPWPVYEDMLRVNVVAVAELLHRLWGELTSVPGRGAINVASTAGFQPMPWFAAYAATKAFVRSLSAALSAEARARGARITALCPGPTHTEFGRVAGAHWKPRGMSLSPEEVARRGLAAYERGKVECTPGVVNWLTSFVAPRAPLALTLAATRALGRKVAAPEALDDR